MPNHTPSHDADTLAGIRRASLEKVVRAVQRAPGASQSELAAKTGLAMGAVSSLVGDLLAGGILVDDPHHAQRGRGRPKRALTLSNESADLVGVTITRTDAVARSATLAGSVIATARRRFDDVPTPAHAAAAVTELLDETLRTSERARAPRIAVSIPGAIRPSGMAAIELEWMDEPPAALTDGFTARGWPVPLLGNDGSFATLAESFQAPARDARNTVVILLSRGLGGSAIVDGTLLHGAEVAPGFGHTPLDPRGELCACGLHGCAELVVSLQRFATRLGDDEHFERMTATEYARELEQRADDGDDAVLDVLADAQQSLHRLGDIVASLLNPESFILTGEGARLARWILPAVVGNTGVTTAAGVAGDEAALQGTLRAAQDQFFADPLGTAGAPG